MMSEVQLKKTDLSLWHTMLVFLLDCLRFSKLLKLHRIEDRISSNLLKREQSNNGVA